MGNYERELGAQSLGDIKIYFPEYKWGGLNNSQRYNCTRLFYIHDYFENFASSLSYILHSRVKLGYVISAWVGANRKRNSGLFSGNSGKNLDSEKLIQKVWKESKKNPNKNELLISRELWVRTQGSLIPKICTSYRCSFHENLISIQILCRNLMNWKFPKGNLKVKFLRQLSRTFWIKVGFLLHFLIIKIASVRCKQDSLKIHAELLRQSSLQFLI